ncbi:MAG TPA: metallophosphoesterase [Chitinophagaceae bacterium]|jgi:predicted phosphodiesterase|nr:metallophosphoesterase [Chitinophagaceae bacterium]
MRNLLQNIFRKPVLWLTERFSSNPEKARIFSALSDLLNCIVQGEKRKGLLVPFDLETGKFIIFSDQHKGSRNGADDFMLCEPNYLTALEYYHQNGFHFISLGDCEELWENTLSSVKREHAPAFRSEQQFISANAFIKIFGNHDLYWNNDPFAPFQLKDIYETEVPIYEGIVLQTAIAGKLLNIFCTHGHQGDAVSDGNWFSKFFISKIWAPLQAYLKINPNTPAYDFHLKTLHNTLMYQWSEQQQDLILITGHTHQPVFGSLTHLERLYRKLLFARKQNERSTIENIEKEIQLRKLEYKSISEDYLKLIPTYFNSGCCCFSDGDITGIEIAEGSIRLIKWRTFKGASERMVLEEETLLQLLQPEATI